MNYPDVKRAVLEVISDFEDVLLTGVYKIEGETGVSCWLIMLQVPARFSLMGISIPGVVYDHLCMAIGTPDILVTSLSARVNAAFQESLT